MFGECDYATEDWYCIKRQGHDGPHESVTLGPARHCPRCGSDTRTDFGHADVPCPDPWHDALALTEERNDG